MASASEETKYYPEITRTAKTESGIVRGIPGGNPIYTVYKGIPYAAPPVGDLRWKAPQPVKPWDGELKADAFSAIAYQPKQVADSFYGKEFFQNPEKMSEDCLYLNIWTPAKSPDEKLPVIFWIHGGALLCGYGHEPEFDGEAFCREGVILVTFNYRLGIIGFYANTELSAESGYGSSGNYGQLDQVAALKWVRKNIAAFGGDPERITIFGQSAGAASVQALVNSPLTKGDMRGAIIMSGVHIGRLRGTDAMRGRDLATAETNGDAYMKAAGCSSVSELRKLSYEALMDVPGVWENFRFGSIIDGYLIKNRADEGFISGSHHDLAYMVGNTADEGGELDLTYEAWLASVTAKYGDQLPDFLEAVGVKCEADFEKFPKKIHNGMVGNRIFAELQLKHDRKPAYLYHFNRKLPGDDRGAFHSSELWYVFGTVSRCWRPMTGVDFDISRAMTKYWANFAKNHDPNGEGLPEWPPYTDGARNNMLFGEEIRSAEIAETPAQKFDRERI